MDHSNTMLSSQNNNSARYLSSLLSFVSGNNAEESIDCKGRVYTTCNTGNGQYPDPISKQRTYWEAATRNLVILILESLLDMTISNTWQEGTKETYLQSVLDSLPKKEKRTYFVAAASE